VREDSLDALENTAADRLVDSGPNPEQAATNQELASALNRAIAALDPSQREVLVLRDIEGLSAPEVARVLGTSVDAVKSRLHRARVFVRQRLAPALGTPAIDTAPGSNCPDALTLFSKHLEGEIAPDVCASLEAHLAHCRHCQAACESLKRTLAICRQSPAPEVPASLAASVRTAIQAFLKQP
jgi:RNA polymerase sigma-70 factor (ECF subfamily)